MAGNGVPQFCKNGNLGVPVTPSAANTNGQGAGTLGTNIFNFFTAGADGSYVEYVRLIPTATAPTTTTATVARIYWSTVGPTGTTTAADTHLLAEVALPAVAADNAGTAVNPIDVPLGFRLPAGAFLHVTNHAAPAANTGWKTMAIAGDY